MLMRFNLIFLALNVIFTVWILNQATESQEKEQAFNECIEEVSNKCRSVISYATMLEKENSKLNKKLRSCRESR